MEYVLLCPGYFHQNIHPCSGTADSRQNSVSLECESYGGAICRGSRNLIELSSPPCPGWHSPINDKNICIHWKIFQLSTSRSCTDWQQTVHAATPATNCCCVPDGSQFAIIRDGHCESLTEVFTGPYHHRHELWWKWPESKWHHTWTTTLGQLKIRKSYLRATSDDVEGWSPTWQICLNGCIVFVYYFCFDRRRLTSHHSDLYMTSNTERPDWLHVQGVCLNSHVQGVCLNSHVAAGWCEAGGCVWSPRGLTREWSRSSRSQHWGSHQPAGRQGWTLHTGNWDGHSGHTDALWDLSYLWTKLLLHYSLSMIPQTWPTSNDQKITIFGYVWTWQKSWSNFWLVPLELVLNSYNWRKNWEEGAYKCPP